MGPIARIFKDIFFWHYGRSTWQYDVLCVLILAFVFLTPKSCFDNGEPRSFHGHQTGLTRVYIPVTNQEQSGLDQSEIERRIRDLTGKTDASINRVQRQTDTQGRTVAYAIDID
jgi:hypothetical protein